MELLLAFEKAGNLEGLAEHLAKDQSVISRNLQKLASDHPVLAKVGGRWRITPLGRQINIASREHLLQFETLLGSSRNKLAVTTVVPENSLLIAINAQKALHDPSMGRRNNTSAERNIFRLFQYWRENKRNIIHVKHVSENPASFFFKNSVGVEFIENLSPKGKERILEKHKASAFVGTSLEKVIRKTRPDALVLVGFTGGECIDATARQASDLGFRTFIVGDATATFDIVGPKGKLHKAEKIHKNTLANLHALFAEVLETDSILAP